MVYLPPIFRHYSSGLTFVVVVWVLFALGGCLPAGASFKPGLGTTLVTGTMDVDPARLASDGGPLIVVYKYHYTFITLDDGRTIRRPTAHVVPVDASGKFSISMPSDVVAMDILFIAPGHLTDTFQFERVLGVGEITFHAHLPPMADWRSHYYTFLEPLLQHLIVEPRYELAPQDQKALGDWLRIQQRRLASPDAKRSAGPPARSRDEGGTTASLPTPRLRGSIPSTVQ